MCNIPSFLLISPPPPLPAATLPPLPTAPLQVMEELKEAFELEEAEGQMKELEEELQGKDLQEQGATLVQALRHSSVRMVRVGVGIGW